MKASFDTPTRGRARARNAQKDGLGHNGGPPIPAEPRHNGRPTIDAPKVRERIYDLLLDGVPIAAICRHSGMPSRRTFYNWRRADPVFNDAVTFHQTEGFFGLCDAVKAEVDLRVTRDGAKAARQWFARRRLELARQNLKFFGAG
jgi:hypothetical protein